MKSGRRESGEVGRAKTIFIHRSQLSPEIRFIAENKITSRFESYRSKDTNEFRALKKINRTKRTLFLEIETMIYVDF